MRVWFTATLCKHCSRRLRRRDSTGLAGSSNINTSSRPAPGAFAASATPTTTGSAAASPDADPTPPRMEAHTTSTGLSRPITSSCSKFASHKRRKTHTEPSWLPTRVAARTNSSCRRFHHKQPPVGFGNPDALGGASGPGPCWGSLVVRIRVDGGAEHGCFSLRPVRCCLRPTAEVSAKGRPQRRWLLQCRSRRENRTSSPASCPAPRL